MTGHEFWGVTICCLPGGRLRAPSTHTPAIRGIWGNVTQSRIQDFTNGLPQWRIWDFITGPNFLWPLNASIKWRVEPYSPIFPIAKTIFWLKEAWLIPKYAAGLAIYPPRSPTVSTCPTKPANPLIRAQAPYFPLSHRSPTLPRLRWNPISSLFLPYFFWHVPMQATVWKPLGSAIA